ncbi:hypothetical protein [Atopobium sp. oral taxon 416]|uniref:hypothetical protein n=1 Tax=Atopobium sp. oral taxon 416 TaxID=712157 RepID=UPI001BA584C5|nr:hypothetical protein [Atopobium sp. oral taxon 416]QUC04624.1 hypothetical protein J4859_06820 [Atopobium sp. oral taxon 416]
MYRNKEPIARIAKKVGVCEPTARKYAKMEDLSPKMPKEQGGEALLPQRVRSLHR